MLLEQQKQGVGIAIIKMQDNLAEKILKEEQKCPQQ